jgi:hypothetical protein
MSEPVEKTPMPLAVRGERDPGAAACRAEARSEGGGTKTACCTPAMRACDGPLKSASRIAIRSRGPQRARQMQRQGALADAALARAHGHEVAHPGEPVGDAGALLGNLLEDARAAVAGDVVVPLHGADALRLDSLHRPAPAV